MSFNFVNLACVQNYFNLEILIHGVFLLCMRGKKRSMAVYKDIWAAMIGEDLYMKGNHSML